MLYSSSLVFVSIVLVLLFFTEKITANVKTRRLDVVENVNFSDVWNKITDVSEGSSSCNCSVCAEVNSDQRVKCPFSF